jgi:regulator of CtrA degradation
MAQPKDETVVPIGAALLSPTSKTFDIIFHDAVKLVEDTAAYLDGDGRTDSKRLSQGLAMAYAMESMRLTTQLMAIASWTLLVRGLREGNTKAQEFQKEKGRSPMQVLQKRNGAPTEGLPKRLRELIAQCDAITVRMQRFDTMLGPNGISMKEGLSPMTIVRGTRSE